MTEQRQHPLLDSPMPHEDDAPMIPRVILVQRRDNAPLMWGLIVVNLAIFALMNMNEATLVQFLAGGALFPYLVFENNQFYRLFSAMFLHGSLAHLVLNMLALYNIGSQVERLMGTARFALIYFLGGVLGSVLSVCIGDYNIPSVGASGAIFAVWGGILWLVNRHRAMLGENGRTMLMMSGFLLIGNLIIGFIEPQIDNWGHIGGLIGGIVLATLIAPRYRERLVKIREHLPPIPFGEDTHPLTRARTSALLLYTAGVLVIFWVGLFVFRLQTP